MSTPTNIRGLVAGGLRWFENVEKAMLLLSNREYSSNARHGYCRCGEPVAYVRQIRERYNAYVEAGGGREPGRDFLRRG